jgi:hypothetical protein
MKKRLRFSHSPAIVTMPKIPRPVLDFSGNADLLQDCNRAKENFSLDHAKYINESLLSHLCLPLLIAYGIKSTIEESSSLKKEKQVTNPIYSMNVAALG